MVNQSETPAIRLLLVDDHPMVREGLRAVLGINPDFEVVGEAADGHTAVAEYLHWRPDVTLMDLRLPGMDGIQAMSAIRKLDPGAKFVVLTTFDKRSDVEQSLAAGAQGFLLKNSSAEETMATLRRVHEGGGALDPELLRRVQAPTGRQALSEREIQVLGRVAHGVGNKQIADELDLSLSTVKFHLEQIRTKLGAKDRTEAAMIAMRDGIIQL